MSLVGGTCGRSAESGEESGSVLPAGGNSSCGPLHHRSRSFCIPLRYFPVTLSTKGRAVIPRISTLQGTLPLAIFWSVLVPLLCECCKEGWPALRSTGLGNRKPVPDPSPPSPTLWPPQSAYPKWGRPLYDHARSPPGGQLQGGRPLEAQELTLGAYYSSSLLRWLWLLINNRYLYEKQA